ncbi:hypothetical protein ACH5RR_009205 [Cinchona calisaya]|uniref:Uncharacterized protein n=1 Tax=Cinchona calisaya TaxID=153742 RepID=A0ABD3AFH1_9GENT
MGEGENSVEKWRPRIRRHYGDAGVIAINGDEDIELLISSHEGLTYVHIYMGRGDMPINSAELLKDQTVEPVEQTIEEPVEQVQKMRNIFAATDELKQPNPNTEATIAAENRQNQVDQGIATTQSSQKLPNPGTIEAQNRHNQADTSIEIAGNNHNQASAKGKGQAGKNTLLQLNQRIYRNSEEDERGTFERMYWSSVAMTEGFLKGCRPIIGLDGCFLKSPFAGQLLTAMGRDGNDNMFPIVLVVVKAERAMVELERVHQQDATYMKKIRASLWSRSHFGSECKSDIVVNNLNESFNNYCLLARSSVEPPTKDSTQSSQLAGNAEDATATSAAGNARNVGAANVGFARNVEGAATTGVVENAGNMGTATIGVVEVLEEITTMLEMHKIERLCIQIPKKDCLMH